jgi:hypothetical protein
MHIDAPTAVSAPPANAADRAALASRFQWVRRQLDLVDAALTTDELAGDAYSRELAGILMTSSFAMVDARDDFLALFPDTRTHGVGHDLGVEVAVVGAVAGKLFGIQGDERYAKGALATALDGALRATDGALAAVRG